MHTLADHHLMALVNEGLWEQLLKKYEPVKSCGDFRIDESLEDHTGNDSRVFHCRSKNFTNSDIINIESDYV